MKKYGLASVIAASAVIVLVGCMSMHKKPLPGSQRVIITKQTPFGCRRVDTVSITDYNGFTQSYTSRQHLEVDQIIALKNQAVQVCANVVTLTKYHATYRRWPHHCKIDSLTMAGVAYSCSESSLEGLKPINACDLSGLDRG